MPLLLLLNYWTKQEHLQIIQKRAKDQPLRNTIWNTDTFPFEISDRDQKLSIGVVGRNSVKNSVSEFNTVLKAVKQNSMVDRTKSGMANVDQHLEVQTGLPLKMLPVYRKGHVESPFPLTPKSGNCFGDGGICAGLFLLCGVIITVLCYCF